jgi:hypothetical protein
MFDRRDTNMTTTQALPVTVAQDEILATNLKYWTVQEYHHMSELGILDSSERTELITGKIVLKTAKTAFHCQKSSSPHLSHPYTHWLCQPSDSQRISNNFSLSIPHDRPINLIYTTPPGENPLHGGVSVGRGG